MFSLGEPTLMARLVAATSNEATEWEALEGYMMAAGYLLSRCATVSPANSKQLLDVIFRLSEHKSFPSYSNYVRLAALKGALSATRSCTHTRTRTTHTHTHAQQTRHSRIILLRALCVPRVAPPL